MIPERNVAYAFDLWSEQGWGPWACSPYNGYVVVGAVTPTPMPNTPEPTPTATPTNTPRPTATWAPEWTRPAIGGKP